MSTPVTRWTLIQSASRLQCFGSAECRPILSALATRVNGHSTQRLKTSTIHSKSPRKASPFAFVSNKYLSRGGQVISPDGDEANQDDIRWLRAGSSDKIVMSLQATVEEMQCEIAGLNKGLATLKEESHQRPDIRDDKFKPQKDSIRWETDSSDRDAPRLEHILADEDVAREGAVQRLYRLAQEKCQGDYRAGLELLAGIIAIRDKSKVWQIAGQSERGEESLIGHASQLSMDHDLLSSSDAGIRSEVQQYLLDDYVQHLWRCTYTGGFADDMSIRLGQDIDRLHGGM